MAGWVGRVCLPCGGSSVSAERERVYERGRRSRGRWFLEVRGEGSQQHGDWPLQELAELGEPLGAHGSVHHPVVTAERHGHHTGHVKPAAHTHTHTHTHTHDRLNT